MMNIKKIAVCFLVLITCLSFNSIKRKSITGPSSIYSQIKPISINKKGEILCKTIFTKNEMGAHSAMKIEYGFCVITNETIIEFLTKTIEPTPEESYYTQKKYWDSIFKSETNQKEFDVINKRILKDKYNFYSINLNAFKRNQILSISDIEKTKNTPLENNKQKGLRGAYSEAYYNDKVYLLYDFGNILIFDNNNDIDNNGSELEFGATFNYYNAASVIEDDNGEMVSFGFDISNVTGVLIIK